MFAECSAAPPASLLASWQWKTGRQGLLESKPHVQLPGKALACGGIDE